MPSTAPRKPALATLLLIVLPVILFLLSFLLGRYPVAPLTVIKVIAARFLPITPDWPPVVSSVVLDVRLPRVIAAMVVGGGLAIAGASYQGVFRNPLVSPFTLGVSAGAGFGAAVAILLFGERYATQACAFVFGLLAVALCFTMNRFFRLNSTIALVLGGVIVGSLFTALLSLLKYVADPNSKLPVIEFWLLGSLSSVSTADLVPVLVVTIPSAILLLALRWRLNVLAMGDEQARIMGVEVGRLRLVLILLSTLIAASAVSISGIIGWVGLVIPHFARIIVGPDFRRLLPATLSLGACYLLIIDDLARTVTSAEVPLGILTALIGAPVFMLLLGRGKLGWA
ncbi:iron ABC transporter permease [Mesorhizobium sp. INR15]|uniref:FecCD family ABC transporter permease n=1 Tax=Mesorhizobium sp. INR15 TaxID=2654248 RepID=UPI0018967CC0|nr:iron ABC transporter permease [Mesorhizobium sp. INR15]QPC91847.1 iron chelate uptake ABC transporter family permease subunit [Mesorhizobium sp. INR15]